MVCFQTLPGAGMDQQSYSEVKLADTTRCSFSLENMKKGSARHGAIFLVKYCYVALRRDSVWKNAGRFRWRVFRMTEIHN